MSREYLKEDMKYIIENLVEELRECENGTLTTTWKLLNETGWMPQEMDEIDLIDIDFALKKAAKKNHILLDSSDHYGRIEGLPYNLDYVVDNEKAQIKCPRCGSINTARILYGFPAFSEALQKKLDSGKLILGGCIVGSVRVNGEWVEIDPARSCNDCHKKFGTPPLIFAKDHKSAEDYQDLVTSIRFSDGGYFGGYTDIKITKNRSGALVSVGSTRFRMLPPENRQITAGKWDRILNELYSHMYLHEWKKNYTDPYVMDGEDWTLELRLTGGRVRRYHGSNDFPPYWKELKKLFRPYMPKKM